MNQQNKNLILRRRIEAREGEDANFIFLKPLAALAYGKLFAGCPLAWTLNPTVPQPCNCPHEPEHGPTRSVQANHRIMEWFGLEGTLKLLWFQPPAMSRDVSHQPRVLRAPSNLALSTAREGAATASLGSVGQGLTTLRGKNFFLISHLNLPSFHLQLFPLVLSLHTLVRSPSPCVPASPPARLRTGTRSPGRARCPTARGPGARAAEHPAAGSRGQPRPTAPAR